MRAVLVRPSNPRGSVYLTKFGLLPTPLRWLDSAPPVRRRGAPSGSGPVAECRGFSLPGIAGMVGYSTVRVQNPIREFPLHGFKMLQPYWKAGGNRQVTEEPKDLLAELTPAGRGISVTPSPSGRWPNGGMRRAVTVTSLRSAGSGHESCWTRPGCATRRSRPDKPRKPEDRGEEEAEGPSRTPEAPPAGGAEHGRDRTDLLSA